MLIDTSGLARTLQPHHSLFAVTERAIERLLDDGHELNLVPQNLVELWVVATRPIEQNGLGLGMAVPDVATELARLKDMFVLLPDTQAIYPVWEGPVTQHQISGKSAHDARLVAAMQVHGLTSILTFDKSGFSRYSGINAVHPADMNPKAKE